MRIKILCVFGKNQYGDEKRGLSTEYFSFIPALKSLGYEVCFFDSWDRSIYRNFSELNSALIEIVEIENPDIVFSVQLGYEIWLETWDFIRGNNRCKTVNWCTDDSWKYRQHSGFFAHHFDLMVTTYEDFLLKYNSQNTQAILSSWAVPIQWISPPKKAKDCKYQVSFVGAAHGDRKDKIRKIRRAGIKVECFGYGWKNGPIDSDEIPIIFNNSIISLNFSNSNGENQIKARVFEVMGSGGFLLTEKAKNLDKILTNNEISVFDNIDTCIEKIGYYLNNLELRNEVALSGFDKIKKSHTYVSRMKDIIDFMGEIEKKKIKFDSFSVIDAKHKNSIILTIFRNLLLFIGRVIYGKEKGRRFARRLAYEFSWRVFGKDTYKSKGIVGRMFYNE
jgi:spore maturation protein CgeB